LRTNGALENNAMMKTEYNCFRDNRLNQAVKMRGTDSEYIRTAIDIAWKAREHGNHPFGAILVAESGEILLAAENTVVTGRDITGHAELNLVRAASHDFNLGFLAKCSIYTSTEPCPMCAGAIYWANVRRVVYGLSEGNLRELIGIENEEAINLPCRELFDSGNKSIQVIGPVLEDEAIKVHTGFWS
jgi:tRNA(Arg) A34 adenosine deaminase TadA